MLANDLRYMVVINKGSLLIFEKGIILNITSAESFIRDLVTALSQEFIPM